jgi:RNA polymerase sigma-70 factor, ECF subfamily
VARAKSGDMDAIRFLCLRYRNNVYGYVLSILRDAPEAEDATQTVFVELMSVIHKYEPRQVPFTAWLLRVARIVAIDSLRHRRPVPCEEVVESSRRADDASNDRRRGLQQALETLPEDQRKVVVLRHLAGLSPGDCTPHRPHRGLDPRGASPRARGPAPRADSGRMRTDHPHGRAEVSDTVQVVLDVTLRRRSHVHVGVRRELRRQLEDLGLAHAGRATGRCEPVARSRGQTAGAARLLLKMFALDVRSVERRERR